MFLPRVRSDTGDAAAVELLELPEENVEKGEMGTYSTTRHKYRKSGFVRGVCRELFRQGGQAAVS